MAIRWKFHKICPKTEKYMEKQMYHFLAEHGAYVCACSGEVVVVFWLACIDF